MSTCPHCGAPVRWVTTEAGATLGIDPDPHPQGTVTHRLVDGRPRAHVLTGPELPAQEQAWRPHRATCPNTPENRARQARARPRCTVCDLPRDPALADTEPHTTHPTCDPHAARARADWLAAQARGRSHQ